MISPDTGIRIKEDVIFRVIEGEAVLLNLASGQYYSLDNVGTRMWELLLKHGSVMPAVDELLAEYDVDEDQLRADLDRLLTQLADKGLLEMHAA